MLSRKHWFAWLTASPVAALVPASATAAQSPPAKSFKQEIVSLLAVQATPWTLGTGSASALKSRLTFPVPQEPTTIKLVSR